MIFSHLLDPISEQAPVGEDLRKVTYAQSLYYQIKELRNHARTIERQQIQGSESNEQPDWQAVFNLAATALEKETKDLEIITWLIEASLRLHGFAGLRDGFELARLIIEKYWDDVFPLADAVEGVSWRVAPLAGLNGDEGDGVLIAPIGLVPLIKSQSGVTFALWHYQQALALFKISDKEKHANRVAAGAVTFEMLEAAAKETDTDFLLAQRDALIACVAAFKELNQVLDEKVGEDAPASSRVLGQLQACIDCINAVSQDRLLMEDKVVQDDQVIVKKFNDEKMIGVESDQGEISREAVVRSIVAAAKFFRQTEPHSPVSYLLERAVKWSKLPLPELLKELISNAQALDEFCQLAGVELGGEKAK